MMRLVLTFLICTISIWWAIDYIRQMTGKERWGLTKTLVYATICSSLALAVMTAIVVLF